MRPKVIAGNWKMNKDIPETIQFLNDLKKNLQSASVTVIVCPPYTSLVTARGILDGSSIHLGAQDVSLRDDGAFTGEVSVKMLKSAGCQYVIVGHSERRQYFGETDEQVNKKAKKVLAAGMLPIICVGETLQEREAGRMEEIVSAQSKGVLAGMSEEEMAKIIIAYEPVWAIGTGKNATPAQAQEVHRMIRLLISALYNRSVADRLIIQYGGSVKPENAGELLTQPDIDGALVGGACLKTDMFCGIIKAGE